MSPSVRRRAYFHDFGEDEAKIKPVLIPAQLGATEVSREAWHVVGFTYDGKQAVAYLDGVPDARETYNP